MDRRKFLISHVVGSTLFVGCVGSPMENLTGNSGKYTIERYTVKQKDTNSPLQFNSEVIDAQSSQGNPAVVEFSVYNKSENLVRIASAPDPPFGMIFATPAHLVEQSDNQAMDKSYPLWQEKYNTNRSGVSIKKNGETINVNSIQIMTPIKPRETITQAFQIRSDTKSVSGNSKISAGKYVISNSMMYEVTELSNISDEQREMPLNPKNAETMKYEITLQLERVT